MATIEPIAIHHWWQYSAQPSTAKITGTKLRKNLESASNRLTVASASGCSVASLALHHWNALTEWGASIRFRWLSLIGTTRSIAASASFLKHSHAIALRSFGESFLPCR